MSKNIHLLLGKSDQDFAKKVFAWPVLDDESRERGEQGGHPVKPCENAWKQAVASRWSHWELQQKRTLIKSHQESLLMLGCREMEITQSPFYVMCLEASRTENFRWLLLWHRPYFEMVRDQMDPEHALKLPIYGGGHEGLNVLLSMQMVGAHPIKFLRRVLANEADLAYNSLNGANQDLPWPE